MMTKNDVTAEFSVKKGKLHVQSARYKTRIQASSTQTVRVEAQNGNKTPIVCDSRTVEVKGRAATINLNKQFSGSEISVWTIGKDPPTRAESRRREIVWEAFHRKNRVLYNSFVSTIWLSKALPQGLPPLPPPPSIEFDKPLNPSQEAAIKRILSDAEEDRITVIHGPPGTGKTTVIAAATNSISVATPKRSVWLVAQSNVAVKNIAEKLASVDFYKFCLLVSEGFHFDWHEHIYSKIERNVIRSDDFPKDHVMADRQLLDARVILCTLSMMSADAITIFAKVAPVQMVIVDEASQIELGAYIPLLHTFSRTLAKLVFIGDDKQYRMPCHIGNFISRHIYDCKLQTVHKDTSWNVCRFVDVTKGVEQKNGHSWTNQEEFAMILHVARRLIKQGKSFRIITGYDAQRNFMESRLKAAKLPWEDKVFNVDAFQGNEEDYILISVVRSSKPGFLSNERRANVMLSRCKRGMFIFSSRTFLGGPGSHTLVGRLAAECGERAWISSRQILNGSW
ncbi:hypothetical protein EWM64_g4915 [Hericium alpestre]|uniref:DNA2/NAM7 helicase-like C-terminal domain-containing protein n=1 Tax=Hericium alpestre TaxID=135208 RepID=A0A4Z0A069_9AGAM|nr:hypothetical protein EWM64_g4915 [Hericium alpestre]